MNEIKIGLQLYSVRDKMAKDMDETLRAVKEIGYDYVEFAGYFEKSAEEIAALLRKHGLTCISVHQGLDFYREGGIEAINFIKTLGASYSAIPWYRKEEYEKDLDGTLALFTEMGKFLAENGLPMLYHNHDFEFGKISGDCIIDKIYSTVPAAYLNPEFDTCWIKYAGYDPCEYLDRYAGRYEIVHLKDFTCKTLGGGPVYALIGDNGTKAPATKEEREFRFRPVGSGMQDIPAIMNAAIRGGAHTFIVEQDESYEQDSLDAAKESRAYLRSIGY